MQFRYGYRLDHFERKRKKEARAPKKESAMARKVRLRALCLHIPHVFRDPDAAPPIMFCSSSVSRPSYTRRSAITRRSR